MEVLTYCSWWKVITPATVASGQHSAWYIQESPLLYMIFASFFDEVSMVWHFRQRRYHKQTGPEWDCGIQDRNTATVRTSR